MTLFQKIFSKFRQILTSQSFQYITVHFVLWRTMLELIERIGSMTIISNNSFLGPIPWANFDGFHYLSIADRGYVQFEEAFFPGYSYLIRLIGERIDDNYIFAGMFISLASFYLSLFITWQIIPTINSIPRKQVNEVQQWCILFLLYFPTSFFFASIYTESLFFLLLLTAFYALSKGKKMLFGLIATIASGVRLVGAFLLVPGGLFYYMYYLYKKSDDPLLFMHVQSAFGANRSGDELVILPQVLWRYANILIKVPLSNYDWWIALVEIVMFFGSLILLWIGWKMKIDKKWIYFSLAAILLPTLTGTLSSIPRYVLIAFPMFIVLSTLPKQSRSILFIIFMFLFMLFTLLFTRGYWVA